MIELDPSSVLEKLLRRQLTCTERTDIVNRYKMPKYLVRFAITF